jgi:hypothetical protein
VRHWQQLAIDDRCAPLSIDSPFERRTNLEIVNSGGKQGASTKENEGNEEG